MIAVLREMIYLCCMVMTVICAIAAVTIAVAIVLDKLSDPQAWTAAVFFAAIGVASLIAGRAAKISNE